MLNLQFLFLSLDDAVGKNLPSESCESLLGHVRRSVSALKDVRCLDQLIRAHTLLAVMSRGTSHDHRLHLLTAFSLVLHVWQVRIATALTVRTRRRTSNVCGTSCVSLQVSMATVGRICSETAKSQAPPPPPSAGSKKAKDKKVKDVNRHIRL